MLYKFKSKAGGDVIMLGADGDRVLAILGRVPAAQGIIEAQAMPQAIASLNAAVLADPPDADDPGAEAEPGVALRRRLWPLLELLQKARAAEQPVVWGV